MHGTEVKRLRANRSLPAGRPLQGGMRRVATPILPERSASPQTRGVRVGKQLIGGSSVTWFAGPGTVESSSQMVAIGASLEELGVKFIRAGTFRREGARGDGFTQGLAGLKLLRATAKRYGLYVVSEIFDLDSLDSMVEFCDVIEVRAGEDLELLRALGTVERTVIFHRSPTMTLESYLEALRILEQGGRANIVLAESGVASFDPNGRQLLDLSSVITLKRETPYPVMVDCSAVAADPSYADQLAIAAVAAGSDGVMVEINPASATVASDSSARAVLPYQLRSMIRRIEALKFTLNALLHKDFEEVDQG